MGSPDPAIAGFVHQKHPNSSTGTVEYFHPNWLKEFVHQYAKTLNPGFINTSTTV